MPPPPPKRRLCFLCDSLFSIGGVQRVLAVTALQMVERFDVTIATFDPPENLDPSLYGMQDSPIRYTFLSYGKTNGLKTLLCKAWSLAYRRLRLPWEWASRLYARSSFPKEKRRTTEEFLRSGAFDVIVGVHAPLASRLPTMSSRLDKKARLIGWIHNSFEALFEKQDAYLGPSLRRHYAWQMRRLDSVVVLSSHDADRYLNASPTLSTRVIFNPLTLKPGRRSDGTSKTFLSVGRMTKGHKGFDLLIEAFAEFARSDDEWTLSIVGEGPEEENLRRQAEQTGVGSRVRFFPFTPTPQVHYSSAQVYVLASRWEGFGLVLIEAQAHGLPVVSSDLPTSKEILRDDALYFRCGDARDLCRQLRAATQIAWNEWSARAVENAGRFSPSEIAEQWTEVLGYEESGASAGIGQQKNTDAQDIGPHTRHTST